MASIKSAQAFLNTYHLKSATDKIDADPDTPGIQNPAFNLKQFKADYNALPTKDRYAVFRRLVQGGEREVIRSITGARYDLKDACSSPEMPVGTAFQRFSEQWNNPANSTWGLRLAVAELQFNSQELFNLQALLYSGIPINEEGCINDTIELGTLYQSRQYTSEFFQGIYGKTGPAFWDSDGDFNPYDRTSWDAAFDSKDILPLDKRYWDVQHVLNGLKGLRDLKIGKSLVTETLTVTRTSETHLVISATVALSPDMQAGDSQSAQIAKTYLTEDFLNGLKQRIESAFARSIETAGSPVTFSLSLTLKPFASFTTLIESNANEAKTTVTSSPGRSSAALLRPDVLDEPTGHGALHEFCHLLFDSSDYYNEPLVDGGIRDYALNPGMVLLSSASLMSSSEPTAKITGDEVLAAIANTATAKNKKADADMETSTTVPSPITLPEAKQAYESHPRSFDHALAYARLLKSDPAGVHQAEEIMVSVLEQSENLSILPNVDLIVGLSSLVQSDPTRMAALHEAYIRRYPLVVIQRPYIGTTAYLYYAASLWAAGRKEDAIHILVKVADADSLMKLSELDSSLANQIKILWPQFKITEDPAAISAALTKHPDWKRGNRLEVLKILFPNSEIL